LSNLAYKLPQPRYISQLTQGTAALILAETRGSRLLPLTRSLDKAALPFAGQYRLIDFALSNCLNSGIRKISILSRRRSYELIRHVQSGWPFMQGEFQDYIDFLPLPGCDQDDEPTSDLAALGQHLSVLRKHSIERVMLLSGDHVYKMDYGPLLAHHAESQADLTVACLKLPRHLADSQSVVRTDQDMRIQEVIVPPEPAASNANDSDMVLASMNICVLNSDFPVEAFLPQTTYGTVGNRSVVEDSARGTAATPGLVTTCVRAAAKHLRVEAYTCRDIPGRPIYWRDIGSVDAYWRANMELLEPAPLLDLHDRDWPIWTFHEQLPPARFCRGCATDTCQAGVALNTLVADGAVIDGATVRHSLLFNSVLVRPDSLVQDSILMPDVSIGRRCRIDRAIIDRGVYLPDDTIIGANSSEDARRYPVSPAGVVLVTC